MNEPCEFPKCFFPKSAPTNAADAVGQNPYEKPQSSKPITPKTDEFIEGYIFSKIEKTIIQGFMYHDKIIRADVIVPKSWFGLTRALKRKDYTIPEHQVSKLRIDLKDAVSGYNTDKRSYDYDINIFPDEQYIRFVFEGTYIGTHIRSFEGGTRAYRGPCAKPYA